MAGRTQKGHGQALTMGGNASSVERARRGVGLVKEPYGWE